MSEEPDRHSDALDGLRALVIGGGSGIGLASGDCS